MRLALVLASRKPATVACDIKPSRGCIRSHLGFPLLIAGLDAGEHEADRLAEGLCEEGNVVPDLVRL